MTVIGMTFARGGSVGVPGKNIREVAGKPLIAWTIEEALKCEALDDYMVVSDSPEIRKIAREYGAKTPLVEPISDGKRPLIEKIQWALGELDKEGKSYDAIADIRCTNAVKTWEDIQACIEKLLYEGCDVVCGVTKMIDHHPSRLKQMLADGRLVDVWPEDSKGLRQDLKPPVYIRNGSIYVIRTAAVREGIHFQGGDVRGYEMPLSRSINIDSELDLLTTEVLLNERTIRS